MRTGTRFLGVVVGELAELAGFCQGSLAVVHEAEHQWFGHTVGDHAIT
jgi:hypothetical protein